MRKFVTALNEIAAIDYAGLAYAEKSVKRSVRRSHSPSYYDSYYDSYDSVSLDSVGREVSTRELSATMKAALRGHGFRFLGEGDIRKVYRVPRANWVLKIDYYFASAYDSYRCHAEARNYKRYAKSIEKVSSKKVRLADTVLLSPCIVMQEYVKGRRDSVGRYQGTVQDVFSEVGSSLSDFHDGNYKLLPNGKIVVIDIAGGE